MMRYDELMLLLLLSLLLLLLLLLSLSLLLILRVKNNHHLRELYDHTAGVNPREVRNGFRKFVLVNLREIYIIGKMLVPLGGTLAVSAPQGAL